MARVNIRSAQPADAPELTGIAHAAKSHWGYPQEWIRLWREALTVSPDYVSKHEVFVGEAGGTIVGFYALVPGDDSWELDHFWIRPESMGRGYGKALFTHAVERLKEAVPERDARN